MQRLPTAKGYFAMPHWEQEKAILTLGGNSQAGQLSEVNHYSIMKFKWKSLVDLPVAMSGSAAIIFKRNCLYNFGGTTQKHNRGQIYY